MKPKNQRIVIICIGFLFFSSSAGIMLYALNDSVTFFYTPSEIATRDISPHKKIRIGGMVVKNSLSHKGLDVRFKVTDLKGQIPVHYQGIVPDLFREGQGVVAEGYLTESGVFEAGLILAKHDENYMPPELANLKQQKD